MKKLSCISLSEPFLFRRGLVKRVRLSNLKAGRIFVLCYVLCIKLHRGGKKSWLFLFVILFVYLPFNGCNVISTVFQFCMGDSCSWQCNFMISIEVGVFKLIVILIVLECSVVYSGHDKQTFIDTS